MTSDAQTPMTGVLVMTSQLNDMGSRADQRMLGETVLLAGDGLAGILSELLDFARVESDDRRPESIAFDLRSLVQDVADVLSAPARQRGLEMACRFPDEMPGNFRGDPGRLRRVVTTLIGNALAFTPPGEALLDVIVENTADETVMIRFELVGVGFGITRTHQPALFESFSQIDGDTVHSYGGAGLSLAMSHQLVGLMGGELGVLNELGMGSTFWFTVPLQKVPAASDGETPRGESVTEVAAVPASPTVVEIASQILLAEDNPVNQRVATAMLENLGFHVDVVADGAQAVKAALSTPYRAILMDGQMPILDGYRATTEIRRLQGESNHTPIIAVTGSTMKADQQRCLDAGMDEYLAKPLNVGALGDVLTRWAPDGSDPSTTERSSEPLPPVHVGLDHLDDPDRLVLDTQAIDRLERLGEATGEDLLGQLAPLFLADADARVPALRQAIARGDATAVVRSAHTLSGASANLGATVLARLCATLAADGSVGDLAGSDALLDVLEEELGRVRMALGAVAPASC